MYITENYIMDSDYYFKVVCENYGEIPLPLEFHADSTDEAQDIMDFLEDHNFDPDEIYIRRYHRGGGKNDAEDKTTEITLEPEPAEPDKAKAALEKLVTLHSSQTAQ